VGLSLNTSLYSGQRFSVSSIAFFSSSKSSFVGSNLTPPGIIAPVEIHKDNVIQTLKEVQKKSKELGIEKYVDKMISKTQQQAKSPIIPIFLFLTLSFLRKSGNSTGDYCRRR
jgi:hypothetical protein